MGKTGKTSIAAVLAATAVALAACSGAPDRMAVPQKVTAGTSAYCQTMAEAPGAAPGLDYFEHYIVTPANLPISGTRLGVDVAAAQSANGQDKARFLAAVRNVLGDCRFILAHTG